MGRYIVCGIGVICIGLDTGFIGFNNMLLLKTFSDMAFIRVPREVINNKSLSDSAVRLYIFMMGLNSRVNISHDFLIEKLQSSLSSIKRDKKSLIDNKLLYIHRRGAKEFIGYLSVPGKPAKMEYFKYQDKLRSEINAKG